MSNGRDDFLDALTYQVKEEVVRNYLRGRRIIEEEFAEYRAFLDEYREVEKEAAEYRGHLACLLVGPDLFRRFWRLLGFDSPPLARLGHGSRFGRAPACPLGLTPKGFTKRGKYVNIALQTYEKFREAAEKGRLGAENIFALAREINEDVKNFHLNHDLMAITAFLRGMDLDLTEKKKIMGDNFTASERNELEITMTFKNLRPRNDGVRPWPELPGGRLVEEKTAGFLRDIFRQERETVLPAVS